MKSQSLSQRDFLALTQNATILEADGFGPKVFRLHDGLFLKLFRRKRLLSSALLRPYSTRFAANADRLRTLGVPTVSVRTLYDIQGSNSTGVLYTPLAGQSLAHISQEPGFDWEHHWRPLAEFITELHGKGIYFRSLHLGNIVRTPQGELGLIDISDMRFLGKRLPPRLVRRNIAHFERYIKNEGLTDSFPLYAFHCELLRASARKDR